MSDAEPFAEEVVVDTAFLLGVFHGAPEPACDVLVGFACVAGKRGIEMQLVGVRLHAGDAKLLAAGHRMSSLQKGRKAQQEALVCAADNCWVQVAGDELVAAAVVLLHHRESQLASIHHSGPGVEGALQNHLAVYCQSRPCWLM